MPALSANLSEMKDNLFVIFSDKVFMENGIPLIHNKNKFTQRLFKNFLQIIPDSFFDVKVQLGIAVNGITVDTILNPLDVFGIMAAIPWRTAAINLDYIIYDTVLNSELCHFT